MTILINNAVESTYIFTSIFLIVLILSARRSSDKEFFSVSLTQEIKGLAILAIVFSHIGYFLVSDNRFLFPLSIMAGVGVNLFLFLSGFGLALSAMRNKYSILQFYQKRILKLLVPFWITLFLFFIINFFVLNISYQWDYIVQSFLGFFPRADLSLDINSPLWYLTFILFYYVIFPIIFWRKYPWLSAIVIYVTSYCIVQSNPVFLSEVTRLYKVHTIAFPFGVFVGSMIFSSNKIRDYLLLKYHNFIAILVEKSFVQRIYSFRAGQYPQSLFWRVIRKSCYLLLLTFLMAIISFTSYNSGIGEPNEQIISLITMIAILLLFMIKKINIKLLYVFGFYSYEIYLLHWPILSRYDFLLKNLPSWLALVLYLFLFLFLAWLLRKISQKFLIFINK